MLPDVKQSVFSLLPGSPDAAGGLKKLNPCETVVSGCLNKLPDAHLTLLTNTSIDRKVIVKLYLSTKYREQRINSLLCACFRQPKPVPAAVIFYYT